MMNENGHSVFDLVADIESAVQSVPLNDLPRLMGDLECLRAIAELRMRAGISQPSSPQIVGETRYLSVAEVVERFHVKPKWLYRHKRQMPHSQPSRKVLLFPEQAVTKWFASRKGD